MIKNLGIKGDENVVYYHPQITHRNKLYVYTHTYRHKYICVCVYICIHTHIYAHPYMYICMGTENDKSKWGKMLTIHESG